MWWTLEPQAFDFVFVKSKRHGVTAEEGEVVEGAAVVQPQLIEADVVADCGAAAADEYVAARQNDGMDVVEDEDVLNGVVLTAESDDRGLSRPLALAGNQSVVALAR